MKRPFTEAELIRALRSGRSDAIEALLDQFGDRLLRGVWLLLRDHHWAEDVVQETFVAAVRGIRRFRGDSGLYTWLYRIALNQCRMLLRRRRPLLLEEIPEEASPEPAVEEWVIRREDRHALLEALAALPYMYREALVLHYYFDMSVAEIAQTLDAPPSTIKSRLQRGRRRVAILLAEAKRHGEEQARLGAE